MKCKKISLTVFTVGVMISGFVNAAALSDSATINFTGVFQNTTCEINLNNSDVSGKGSIDLYLGAYTTNEITSNADATPAIPFTVNFSNCGSIHIANIVFNGTQTASKLFDVEGSNKDSVGVGVNTSTTASNYLAIGDKTPVTITDGNGSANFYARYVKIGDTPLVDGEANAVATMDITYL